MWHHILKLLLENDLFHCTCCGSTVYPSHTGGEVALLDNNYRVSPSRHGLLTSTVLQNPRNHGCSWGLFQFGSLSWFECEKTPHVMCFHIWPPHGGADSGSYLSSQRGSLTGKSLCRCGHWPIVPDTSLVLVEWSHFSCEFPPHCHAFSSELYPIQPIKINPLLNCIAKKKKELKYLWSLK